MKAYIGIGSNLGDRKAYIDKAIELMHPYVKRVSSIYESEPVEMAGANKFLNAVIEIETEMKPHKLLDYLEDIENKLGRKDKGKHKSRTIDLDILLYENESVNTQRLKIPHPKLKQRTFVLKPLKELYSDSFNEYKLN